jgi:hypothetical protein
MRRVLPWALLGLAAVAGFVGAGLGIANQPPSTSHQPTLSEIVAATRSAETARFTFSSVSTSPNPSRRSVSVGRGTVDFRTNSMTTDQRTLSTSISQGSDTPPGHATRTLLDDQTWIGRTYFARLGIVGVQSIPWIKGHFPADAFGLLGVLDEVDPVGFLENDLEVRGTKVELVGTEVLGKTATTKYRVITPSCPQVATTTVGPHDVAGPIDLWLAGGGRLVQVRNVIRITGPGGSASARSTITSTIRLSDFGAPVAISAPKPVLPNGQGAVAFLTLSPKSCRT